MPQPRSRSLPRSLSLAVMLLALLFAGVVSGGCRNKSKKAPSSSGVPVFLDQPVKWIDADGNGVVSTGDRLLLCFDRSVTAGANLPALDLILGGGAGALGGATWTAGPGVGKMSLNLVGGSTVTLGKTAGTTLQMAPGNTLTNPVSPPAVGATAAATPNTIMGNIVDSGQHVGPASFDIVLFDVDNDTDLDVVAGIAGHNLVFTNTGVNSGVFVAGAAIVNEGPAITLGLCYGNIDLDALPDLVACNGPGSSSIKYLNVLATPGVFATDPAGPPPANRSTMGPAGETATGCVIGGIAGAGNWDGLGGGDVFIATGDPAGQNRVFFSDAFGNMNNDNTLAGVTPVLNVGAANTDTRAVVGGTIDAGGTTDVVTADDNGAMAGTVTCYLVTQAVPPLFVPIVIAGTLPGPRALLLCDLDGDTDQDLVVGYTLGNGMQIFENTGAATGAYALRATVAGGNVFSLACTDADGDGLADLIQGRGNNGGMRIFLNCGAFVFQDSGMTTSGNLFGLAGTPLGMPTGLDGQGLGDIVAADAASVNRVYLSGR